jgi:hypothetical protein
MIDYFLKNRYFSELINNIVRQTNYEEIINFGIVI